MELFEKIKNEKEENEVKKTMRQRSKYIKIDTSSKSPNISELHFNLFDQLLISPFVFVDPDGLLSIPTSRDLEDEKLMQLATYFENVKKKESNEEKTFLLQTIKKDYADLFKEFYDTNKCSKLIYELYPNGTVENNIPLNIELEEYIINLEMVDKIENWELHEFWNFIKSTFIPSGQEFILWPDNWGFMDSIKDKICIRMFANVCNQIKLLVDEEANCIRYICIS